MKLYLCQVKSLEEEIRKEKEELNANKNQQDATIKKLKNELSSTKQKLVESEVNTTNNTTAVLLY